MPKRKTMREILMERLFGFFQGGLNWISNLISAFMGVSAQKNVKPNVPFDYSNKNTNTPADAETRQAPANQAPEPEIKQPSLFEALSELISSQKTRQMLFGAYAMYRACDNENFAAAAAAQAYQDFLRAPNANEENNQDDARNRNFPRPRPAGRHRGDSLD